MIGKSFSRAAPKTALALFVAALTIGVAQADIDSARDALGAGNYSQAISDLDQVLDKSPKDQEARFLKGLALARSGDTDSALKLFNALVEDQPKMAEAWNNLGVLRARDGDLSGARDALLQATRIDPKHGPAQENLGDIYVALARNAYTQAGKLESDNSLARAKSQQLAAFIGNSQGTGGGQGGAQGNSTAQTASADSQNVSPPPASNATRSAQGQASIDTSTPEAALKSWAQAWSDQNVDGYLSVYSNAFVPDDGASRSAWAAERSQRVSAPAQISIDLSDIQVARRGSQALVTFDQRYRSNTYQDQEHKALLMDKSGDGWQILREGLAGDVEFTAAAQSSGGPTSESADKAGGDSMTQPMPAPVSPSANQSSSKNNGSDAQARVAASGGSADNTRSDADADADSSAAAGSTADNAAQADSGAAAAGQRSAPAEMLAASKAQASRQAVRDTLQRWAQAWSSQNMQAYLNAYSDNYRPRDGETRTDWVRDRKTALKQPRWIKIDISGIQVSLLDDQRAQASFNQHYQSDSFEDRERKRVTLVQEDGGWRIVRES